MPQQHQEWTGQIVTREKLAEIYQRQSGGQCKSDCQTSRAPAFEPLPCDCKEKNNG